MSQRYRCPECKSEKGLWRGVTIPGWQSVNSKLEPIGGSGDREADWSNAEEDFSYGCGECQWDGVKTDLERIGIDGEPLEDPTPGQLNLEVDR